MTTERPYHRPMTINEAMMELQKCSGTQFCPTALDAFAVGFALNYRDR
jgi:HD-GYP domain-containing protein (c-di-GMP phosphodiesterase class II)